MEVFDTICWIFVKNLSLFTGCAHAGSVEEGVRAP